LVPDQLYLSYWIRDFTDKNTLRQFEKLVRKFPFSQLGPGISMLRIQAIEYAEPPLLEEAFTEMPEIDTVLKLAKEFENADCAYEIEGAWDLWQFEDDWKLKPAAVSLACYGPAFANELGDNLRLDLGRDELFLPAPDIPGSARTVQSNIRSLLRLAHDLDDCFAVKQRRLWTESGENFIERLQQLMGGGS
jgi:hypothetical protein